METMKIKIKGKLYNRIPCGENDFLPYNTDGKPCKDCGAQIGEYHAPYCEAEKCPIVDSCDYLISDKFKCSGQLCGCEFVSYDTSK